MMQMRKEDEIPQPLLLKSDKMSNFRNKKNIGYNTFTAEKRKKKK